MQAQSVVLVFEASDTQLEKSFPFSSPTYFPTYKQFITKCQQASLDIRISFNHLYKGNSVFSGTFSFQDGNFVWSSLDHQATCIVIRSLKFPELLDGTENTINRPVVIKAAADKATTFKLFPDYMLTTLELDPATVQEQIDQVPGDFIVCKPRSGHGGAGIFIGSKEDFKKIILSDNLDQPSILQQFLDTSKGIPGITTGIHDLRIILSGHQPISYVRIPKPGTLLANLSQGGEAKALEYEEIPPSALAIAHEIEKKLSPDFPHFYCADFIFGPDGTPYLCELNSQPGFSYDGGEGPAFVHRYHETLLSVIQDALAQAT